MKRLIVGAVAAIAVGLCAAPVASADDIDCFTQETRDCTRTTCYSGFPDYDRIITTCDGNGRCTTRWA